VGTTRVTDGETIGGVVISNVNKVWWPDEGITKGDIARFYHAISPLLLPWMQGRPLTAERCPDGMLGGCFYRKNFPEGNIPVGAPRLRLRAESTGKDVNYVVGGNLEALLGLVRVGCIAMHIMNSRVGSMRDADWLAFDLDPSSAEFSDTVRAGGALRVILDEHGLVSFPKTSDPFRNAYLQTIVTPYSVRRRPGATVSMPLAWDEVTARLDPRRFTIRTLEKHIASGDPWADFKKKAQRLPG
jgi:bifunctional non-homologous end joining protein LigD